MLKPEISITRNCVDLEVNFHGVPVWVTGTVTVHRRNWQFIAERIEDEDQSGGGGEYESPMLEG